MQFINGYDLSVIVDDSSPVRELLGRVHFAGIGGTGMSGIAHLLLDLDVQVSGCDLHRGSEVLALESRGVSVSSEHATEHAETADTLVVTSALRRDNPDYVRARELGIAVLHRSEILELLASKRRRVAVAGSNGKTTSTGMIISALEALGADPSFVNGGVMFGQERSGRNSRGETFVFEADESDGSFLSYRTQAALITSIDSDHESFYGSTEALGAAFAEFARNVDELLVLSNDDPGLTHMRDISEVVPSLTFGRSKGSDVRVLGIAAGDEVEASIDALGTRAQLQLRFPGRHNVVNAAGAIAVLIGLGFGARDAVEAVEQYPGMRRRFELRGVVHGVRIFDDIAHHPTKIRAAVTAARSIAGTGRIIVLHQPHLYSRTSRFATEIAAVYERFADHTIVLDVEGSRELAVVGVSGELISRAFRDQSKVSYRPDWEDAASEVSSRARPGDIVMTVSGHAERLIPSIIKAIVEKRSPTLQ